MLSEGVDEVFTGGGLGPKGGARRTEGEEPEGADTDEAGDFGGGALLVCDFLNSWFPGELDLYRCSFGRVSAQVWPKVSSTVGKHLSPMPPPHSLGDLGCEAFEGVLYPSEIPPW